MEITGKEEFLMLTQEEMHEVTQRIMRIEAEAEARTEAMLDRLIAKRERLSQAGIPATTMPLSNNAQDTSQTPSDGE